MIEYVYCSNIVLGPTRPFIQWVPGVLFEACEKIWPLNPDYCRV